MHNPLSRAMTIYRKVFGHSVPSYEVKNAAITGTSKQLAGLVLAYVGSKEPHPIWKTIEDPYEHERNMLALASRRRPVC